VLEKGFYIFGEVLFRRNFTTTLMHLIIFHHPNRLVCDHTQDDGLDWPFFLQCTVSFTFGPLTDPVPRAKFCPSPVIMYFPLLFSHHTANACSAFSSFCSKCLLRFLFLVLSAFPVFLSLVLFCSASMHPPISIDYNKYQKMSTVSFNLLSSILTNTVYTKMFSWKGLSSSSCLPSIPVLQDAYLERLFLCLHHVLSCKKPTSKGIFSVLPSCLVLPDAYLNRSFVPLPIMSCPARCLLE